MWLERFVIVVTSLHRDFLPSSWGMYYADVLGLVDLPRHDRPVLRAAVPVHPLPAGDLDLRDARAGAETRTSRATAAGAGDVEARPAMPHDGAARDHGRHALYGLLAEFETPDDAGRRGAARRTPRATRRSTPTRRSRSRGWPRRSASRRDRSCCRRIVAARRASVGGVAGYVLQYWHRRSIDVPDQRRRPAAAQLAGVHLRSRSR